MNPWAIGGLALGALALAGAGGAAAWRRYLASSTADRLGLSNEPPDAATVARLTWLLGREALVLTVLRERYPDARRSSAFRNAVVNAAVGGVATSRHQYGLALDFIGIADLAGAARWLRANASRLGEGLRTVIAESDHLHLDWYDPLGAIDPVGASVVSWLREQSGSPRFVALG